MLKAYILLMCAIDNALMRNMRAHIALFMQNAEPRHAFGLAFMIARSSALWCLFVSILGGVAAYFFAPRYSVFTQSLMWCFLGFLFITGLKQYYVALRVMEWYAEEVRKSEDDNEDDW